MSTIKAPSSNIPEAGPVAPLWHTAVLVAFFVLLAAAGTAFADGSVPKQPAPAPTDHALLYLSLTAAEWGLLYYVWKAGLSRKGVRLRALIGGRWMKPRDVIVDVALAVGVWGLWEAVEAVWTHLAGPGSTLSVQSFLPRKPDEIAAWIGLSITAGICEEAVFRGYLLKQFTWMTNSRVIALILQAAIFGVAHGYQGLAACAHIAAYGGLFGVIALWRSSLRPGIMAHALTDILAGLFGL